MHEERVAALQVPAELLEVLKPPEGGRGHDQSIGAAPASRLQLDDCGPARLRYRAGVAAHSIPRQVLSSQTGMSQQRFVALGRDDDPAPARDMLVNEAAKALDRPPVRDPRVVPADRAVHRELQHGRFELGALDGEVVREPPDGSAQLRDLRRLLGQTAAQLDDLGRPDLHRLVLPFVLHSILPVARQGTPSSAGAASSDASISLTPPASSKITHVSPRQIVERELRLRTSTSPS